MKTTIFTDGASKGNPGPGGWGAIIVADFIAPGIVSAQNSVVEIGGRATNTTNNRMELTAVIESLKWVRKSAEKNPAGAAKDIVIYLDSSYVKRGATEWLKNWQVNNWHSKVNKKEILNKDLWQELAAELARGAAQNQKIEWKLIGGHIGIAGNERADVIATSFAEGKPTELFSGALSDYAAKNKIDILKIADDATLVKEKSKSRSHSRAKAYSYVSMVRGAIQTHATWAECEARVKGVPGARFKKAVSVGDEGGIIEKFSQV
ncbi:MAG: viroplasmin family protein [Patescibacteria group bacterium]